jgi:hypothetical protein
MTQARVGATSTNALFDSDPRVELDRDFLDERLHDDGLLGGRLVLLGLVLLNGRRALSALVMSRSPIHPFPAPPGAVP